MGLVSLGTVSIGGSGNGELHAQLTSGGWVFGFVLDADDPMWIRVTRVEMGSSSWDIDASGAPAALFKKHYVPPGGYITIKLHNSDSSAHAVSGTALVDA